MSKRLKSLKFPVSKSRKGNPKCQYDEKLALAQEQYLINCDISVKNDSSKYCM